MVMRFTLTPDLIALVFAEKPHVKRAYDKNVPHNMSEKEFWTRYLQHETAKEVSASMGRVGPVGSFVGRQGGWVYSGQHESAWEVGPVVWQQVAREACLYMHSGSPILHLLILLHHLQSKEGQEGTCGRVTPWPMHAGWAMHGLIAPMPLHALLHPFAQARRKKLLGSAAPTEGGTGGAGHGGSSLLDGPPPEHSALFEDGADAEGRRLRRKVGS